MFEGESSMEGALKDKACLLSPVDAKSDKRQVDAVCNWELKAQSGRLEYPKASY